MLLNGSQSLVRLEDGSLDYAAVERYLDCLEREYRARHARAALELVPAEPARGRASREWWDDFERADCPLWYDLG